MDIALLPHEPLVCALLWVRPVVDVGRPVTKRRLEPVSYTRRGEVLEEVERPWLLRLLRAVPRFFAAVSFKEIRLEPIRGRRGANVDAYP